VRSIEELDRAVRRIEDRQQIDDLVSRFAIATDARDYETLRDCLADDATWGRPELEGADAILEWLQGRLRSMAITIHTPHPGLVTFVTDDLAEGIVPAHAEASHKGVTMMLAARCQDRYVRQGGQWRFQYRDVAAIYALPVNELTRMHESLRLQWPGTEPAAAPLFEGIPSFARDQAT
jgi:ketosteroid isomerase-like protein